MIPPAAYRCTQCQDIKSGRFGRWRCHCGNVRLVSGFLYADAGNQTIEPMYEPSHGPNIGLAGDGVHYPRSARN